MSSTSTQPKHSTKRKATEDLNPLLDAAKRVKRDQAKALANKRKLLNGEEPAGGRLIVHVPTASSSLSPLEHAPSTSAAAPPRAPSRSHSLQPHPPEAGSSKVAGPSRPPAKKFRAEHAAPKLQSRPSTAQEDPALEEDVRAMNDEADYLRRKSRSNPTPSQMQAPIRFPPTTTPTTNRRKTRDTSINIPEQETPQLERNKQLRDVAMAGIGSSDGAEPSSSQTTPRSSGHRRRSSVGSRGKRISEVFETTGIISQPHNSVSESSFYKHIDLDLSEPQRVSQLLIWCSARAASSYATTPPSTSTASSSTAPPPSKLPVLSAVGAAALKNVQDDMVRMLAERKIPIRLYTRDELNEGDDGQKKENAQNTKNRQWETTYSSQIQRARQEADRWNYVDTFYEDYIKRITPTDSHSPSTPSSKAKGKQRASDDDIDEDDDWNIREHALPERFRSGLDLAKAILSQTKARGDREKRVVGPASTYATHIREWEEREAELQRQEKDLEFNLDMINSFLNTARETTNIAEATLDQRFALLSFSLASRSNPMPPESVGTGHLLSSYVPRELGVVVSGGSADPQELMRALANVDRERPRSQVGDAARRAVREVQRAEERGAGIGERRLTGVPTMPTTPRKMPGTPRRATTPGRGTTPGRDREHR
ncbi:hypothetical protein EYR36_008976 [Pleurotus pulmonarius]|nr:hypothetical protein EYR36_008976 [Pleurotus pulmonarius]